MNGQWHYLADRDLWSMVIFGRQEMTISGPMLRALCERVDASKEEALAWVSSRPSRPWSRAA
ncbi:MAG: hypothetical protein ACI8S6_004656 [Myxococcota bacterium]|jgi:hypothetical protein